MITSREQYGDYTFVTVSDTGVNHNVQGIPNQDAVMFYFANDDFALAVSDGVGSCARARASSSRCSSPPEKFCPFSSICVA